jgi:hypothetical protein
MTKVISNEVLERLENTFLYINLFIGDYNNSIDKLPQILNNKSEMKSCVTNIRNSIRKINKFIIGNKTKNELQQIYSSCNEPTPIEEQESRFQKEMRQSH